jgi:glycosyltransferase involved in cell wall biosynthesis
MQLARAVRAIPRSIPFELQVRGPQLDDAARRFAGELTSTIGDDSRVRFEPAVPARDVPKVLAELDVLLCPSISFENGPTIALEAMAAGTPVIGSRVGNLVEIVDDGVNGRLVTAGDVDALRNVLVEVASHPRATVDVWRRALAEPRTMDDIARDYLDLYVNRPTPCESRS